MTLLNNISLIAENKALVGIMWSFLQVAAEGVMVWAIAAVIYELIPHRFNKAKYGLILLTMGAFPVLFITHLLNYEPIANTRQVISAVFVNPPVISEDINVYNTWYQNITELTKTLATEYFHPLVMGWLVGMLFFSTRLLWQAKALKKLRKQAIPIQNTQLQSQLKVWQDRLKISRKVALLGSKAVFIPLTMGIMKPVIILPLSILGQMPYDQLETIVMHELAHIKRYDYLVQLLQRVVEAVFFFHPAIWWCSNKLQNQREWLCDDMVLTYTRDKAAYARALLAANAHARSSFLLAMGLSVNKTNSLSYRIKRMIMEPKTYSRKMQWFVPIIMLAFVFITVAFTNRSLKNTEITKGGVHNGNFNHPVPMSQISDDGNFVDDTLKLDCDGINFIDLDNQLITKTKSIDGNKTQYKIQFKDGEVVAMWVNGEKIPKEDFPKHQKLIKDTKQDIADTEEKLRQTMQSLEDIDLEVIMDGVEAGLEAVAGIDWEGLMDVVDDALESIDTDEIEMELEKAMSEFDKAQVHKEIERAMEEVDTDEIRREIAEGLREARIEMHREMARESMRQWDPEDIRKQMYDIRMHLDTMDKERVRQEMMEVQKRMHQLRKDMLLEQSELRDKAKENISTEEKLDQMEQQLEKLEKMKNK